MEKWGKINNTWDRGFFRGKVVFEPNHSIVAKGKEGLFRFFRRLTARSRWVHKPHRSGGREGRGTEEKNRVLLA